MTTAIPKGLHQRLKLFCVEREIEMQEFIAAAFREKLDRPGKPPRR